jgi:anaerobic selenocysteine-containing dehydrogenase
LGPPREPGNVAAPDVYSAILEGEPYPVRALLAFGGNTLLAIADTLRGREALQRLEFYVQVELFHTPTSRFADVLLPAASFLETEALFVSPAGFVRRRPRVVAPLYERRPDVEIIFDLACRLGFADRFGGGDLATAYDEVLAPAGLTWDAPPGPARRRSGGPAHSVSEVRRPAPGRPPGRLLDADAEDRAVLGHAGCPRAVGAAGLRGAGREPGPYA